MSFPGVNFQPYNWRYFGTLLTLVFQNPPVIPCEDRYLEPLKTEPQEVWTGVKKHRSSQGMTGRLGLQLTGLFRPGTHLEMNGTEPN